MGASLSGVFSVQEFTDLGAPLVGGRLYTYTAGTTTLKVAYTDAAGLIPHTYTSDGIGGQYIALNARGELPAALFLASGGYDLALKRADGSTVWTRPGVGGNDAANAFDAAIRADLASTASATKGDFLIGVKRTDIAGAAGLTLHDWNQAASVNVRQVGVTGDGSTDDAALLNTLGALGIPLFIPYTATGYKIASTVTFSCDVFCEGFFTPTTAIGGAANDYNRFAIVIASAGYARQRRIDGIRVGGNTTLRSGGVSGIRVDCEASELHRCMAQQLNYGIVVRMYSVTLKKCMVQQCNTNLSAYARDFSHEINALTIDGGSYDSAVNVGINLGDTSWSDALAAGNSHGVCINIVNGVATDGAESRLDNVGAVNIAGIYTEGTNTDCLWRLGGSGDGNTRNVTFSTSFLKNARYAVKCMSAVDGLVVGPNHLSGITSCEVKMSGDIYGVRHREGSYAGCFGQGPGPVGLAFRSLPFAQVVFPNVSIERDYLERGTQDAPTTVGKYYPSSNTRSGPTVSTNVASTACSVYATPATGKAGTVAGTTFTFTTLADCYAFNGGDQITTAPAGATYVRSVDYAAGTMQIDGGVTAAGAATVSQAAIQLHSETTTFSGVAPTTGTWAQGDRAINGLAAIGQPKAWLCRVAGTPGTWTSEGAL